MTPTSSDTDLIHLALNGDSEAFGRLVDRYKDAVYGAAYAHLNDFQDAQDIAQEAFIQAYRRLSSLRSPDRFAGWLCAIVRNLCHSHRRTRRETLPLDEAPLASPPDPADEHDRRALHRHIQRAIAALSDIHRETVTLYYIDGYTCDEVGQFLDVPTGTVKRRLSDARRQLRKEMTDMVRDMFDAHKLPANFRKVVVDSADPPAESDAPRLYLRDDARRGFPIEVGDSHGAWIYAYLKKTEFPRPLTCDLFLRICSAFDISLDGVGITVEDDRYRADLTFARGRKSVTLEADPGDAVALAVRSDAPVYVDEALLEGTRFQRPKKAPSDASGQPESHRMGREAIRRSKAIEVDDDASWALVDRTGGKIEQVHIVVSVHPPYTGEGPEAPPTERARARRISDPECLIPVHVSAVADDPGAQYILVWLSDAEESMHLPIATGGYEANAIAAMLSENRPGQLEPGIHDLIKAVLSAFAIVHERSAIDLLHRTVFYAFGFFHRGKTVKRIDSRPSDAIALALRTNAEIYVHREVMETVGVSVPGDRFDAYRKRESSQGEGKMKKPVQRRTRGAFLLPVEDTVRFTVKSRRKFVWKSSDPSIASVNAEGTVEGLKEGKVSITAIWKGKPKRQ